MPAQELRRAAPYLVGALKLILTQPFDVDTVPQLVRGDYMNLSLTLDLTYSAIDNAFLPGPDSPVRCAPSSSLLAAIPRQ